MRACTGYCFSSQWPRKIRDSAMLTFDLPMASPRKDEKGERIDCWLYAVGGGYDLAGFTRKPNTHSICSLSKSGSIVAGVRWQQVLCQN